jgi:hypothetical protein
MALKEAGGSVVIEVPREQAWEKLRDLSKAHHYVQSVKDTRIDTERHEDVGASRTVFLKDGTDMQETVEEWNEGKGFLIKLHKGDDPAMPIFSQFYFRYAIDDAPGRAGEATLFTPALVYQTRFGPLGWLLGKLIHKKMAGSALDVGIAMKDYYETGEPVTSARFKQLKRAEN